MAKLTPGVIGAATLDAGNASMRAAGRTAWSEEDYDAAALVSNRLWDALDGRPVVEHTRHGRRVGVLAAAMAVAGLALAGCGSQPTTAQPASTPTAVTARITGACADVDLGGIVGVTYLCPSTGPIQMSSDGCDGGPTYAQAEVTAVARYTHLYTSMVCGGTTYAAGS